MIARLSWAWVGGGAGIFATSSPNHHHYQIGRSSPNREHFTLALELGFFKRAHYEKAKLPQYHAIKIPRQERQLFHEEKTGTITKKDWVTSWSGDSDGHVPVST